MMLCGWEGNRRPGGKLWQPTAGWMTYSHLRAEPVHRDHLRAQRSVTSTGSLYFFIMIIITHPDRMPRHRLIRRTFKDEELVIIVKFKL